MNGTGGFGTEIARAHAAGHYTAHLEGFEAASKAAVNWFTEHL
jgi:hypothetical protein